MAEHTQGTWARLPFANSLTVRAFGMQGGREFSTYIADVYSHNGSDSGANADLIAAAPDLLAAVRAQVAYDDRPETEDVAGSKEAFDRRMRIYDALKAAIAKAEGR